MASDSDVPNIFQPVGHQDQNQGIGGQPPSPMPSTSSSWGVLGADVIGAIPIDTKDALQHNWSVINPLQCSAPSTVEVPVPSSSEPIPAVPAPVPPAHNMAQHRKVLRIFGLYALDTQPELWILDPTTERCTRKQIRQHMERQWREANKDQ